MEPDLQQLLLEQLRNIHSHSPEPIGWWPPAIGWWILLFLCLCALIALGTTIYIKHQRNAYRRQAVSTAGQLYQRYQEDLDTAGYLGEMNELLRRVVRQITDDQSFAEKSGTLWIFVLNLYSETPLSEPAAIALSEQLYQPSPEVDVPILHQELSNWIQTHERVVRG